MDMFSIRSDPRIYKRSHHNIQSVIPSIFVRDKPIFSSERMLHKDYYRRSSVEKKNLVVGLDAKTN
jgi:hypothetical protein